MRNRDNDRVLVYSSETGRVRPDRREEMSSAATRKASDGLVRLRREVKGRGGKTVIVISDIPLEEAPLKELAATFKKLCGCGGTAKNGTIEIQGDHRDLLLRELQARGFRVKLAGG